MTLFKKNALNKWKKKKTQEKQYTLLLVEDEPDNLKTLVDFLKDDYTIITAANGREAMELLEGYEREIHLIISDQRMPQVTGVEFLERSISFYPYARRILLSGYTDAEALIASINKAQIYVFVQKPFDGPRLLLTVRRALESYELEKQNKRYMGELEQLNADLETKVVERTQELNRTNEELKSINHELETMDGIVGVINREILLEELFSTLLEQAMILFPRADKGVFLIRDVVTGHFVSPVSIGYDHKRLETTRLEIEDIERTFLEQGHEIADGIFHRTDLTGEKQPFPFKPPQSMLSMVMKNERFYGILLLGNEVGDASFGGMEIHSFKRFREHALTAFIKAGLHQELKDKNEKILSGIRYAQRIQEAALPRASYLAQMLGDHFVVYQPQGIVSGDFFWCHGNSERTFLAVVDCTGHGVPGAFLSMIGHMLLQKIIVEGGQENPAVIMETLDRDFIEAFNKWDNIRDGMELSLCRIDRKKRQVIFSGARSHLYLVRKRRGHLEELRGQRRGIGDQAKRQRLAFNNYELYLEQGDMLYLFSDGFRDQIGPEHRKYGTDSFKHLLEELSIRDVGQQKHALLDELKQFRNFGEQRDDITIVGFRI